MIEWGVIILGIVAVAQAVLIIALGRSLGDTKTELLRAIQHTYTLEGKLQQAQADATFYYQRLVAAEAQLIYFRVLTGQEKAAPDAPGAVEDEEKVTTTKPDIAH
jgi:hypothetical protein